ncbi:sensor histidine kinase [Actinomadura darangshiensis]|uniref:Sensor histidine kinase n=1 Tax=Actinomadura darangshiensis TaxID=705336 RepID=A0A4R5BLK9_9ACTN|nr:histidine kinase [Actinomadura darangshiensis]TDD84754.1 sensor histidine kinase [Actinomadura darangshiensis]
MNPWKGSPQRRVPDLDLEQVDRNGPGGQAFVFWLIVLVWPVWDMAKGHNHPLWLAALALAAFAFLHLAVVRTSFDGRFPMRVPVLLLVAQTGVASAAALGFQGRWFTLFPLLGLATGVVVGHMPRRAKGPELHMLIGIGTVSCLSVLVGWVGGEDNGALAANWYGTVTAGIVTAVILRLFTVIGLLRDAREELAEAAVASERLRFSRDLHDLLGHTLSLMVVKAQAVRRIAERDPAVAAEQAADIETVGRQALDEVRQAVSGYRGRGLADELDAARVALSDSGVDVIVRRTGPPLPPQQDALLGWAVREGVTNVIRHSGAARCEITVRIDEDDAVLEVKDDGTGKGGIGGAGGHGLRGLSERMEAVSGTVQAGSAPEGGFLLSVTVPVASALGAGGK